MFIAIGFKVFLNSSINNEMLFLFFLLFSAYTFYGLPGPGLRGGVIGFGPGPGLGPGLWIPGPGFAPGFGPGLWIPGFAPGPGFGIGLCMPAFGPGPGFGPGFGAAVAAVHPATIAIAMNAAVTFPACLKKLPDIHIHSLFSFCLRFPLPLCLLL